MKQVPSTCFIVKEVVGRGMDVTPFPEAAMPVVNTHGKLLEPLRGRNDVRWTYVNPTGDFQANGERIGAYQLGGEELVLNAAGESAVGCADYAIAIVDELESDDHVH